jgi:hypothetical protein
LSLLYYQILGITGMRAIHAYVKNSKRSFRNLLQQKIAENSNALGVA